MKYGSATRQTGPRFRFVSETIAELKKVVWLTRREAGYLTLLVIIVTAIVGLVLGIIDYGFSRLVNDLLRLGG